MNGKYLSEFSGDDYIPSLNGISVLERFQKCVEASELTFRLLPHHKIIKKGMHVFKRSEKM